MLKIEKQKKSWSAEWEKMMRMLIKHVHSHTLAKKAKIVIQDKHSTTKEITTSMKKKRRKPKTPRKKRKRKNQFSKQGNQLSDRNKF